MKRLKLFATLMLSLWLCLEYAGAQTLSLAGNEQVNSNAFERNFENIGEKLDQLPERLLEMQLKQRKELKEMLENMGSKACPQQQGNNRRLEILKELQKASTRQRDILQKLDTKCQSQEDLEATPLKDVEDERDNEIEDEPAEIDSVSGCWGIYTNILEGLSGNISILQNIDKRLGRFNDQYSKESNDHKMSLEKTKGFLKFLDTKAETKICVKSDDQPMACTEKPFPTSCANTDSSHCSDNKCRITNILYGPEPFLVACDDSTDGGGWTVIQRRIDGSVDFFRGWQDYKAGFGNLDGEFWIGLDKLHALTTTLAPAELLIQMTDHKDILRYVKYGKFSIGNETELYVLKEADDFQGNVGDSFSQHKGRKFTTKDKDNDESYSSNCAELKRGAWWYDSCLWSHLNGFYYKNGVVPNGQSGTGINWYSFHGYQYSLKAVKMMIRRKK